ncbi:hypothetical protein NO995_14820 [Aestuariibaculum sp. M13]|uniref:MutS-related protein n=1 Tax=Aestuariibaculum sp. M13 TaxID=2967132 RepID=UPI002159E6D2|nr:hypothetical protein [Aestuariibaculum sp. M13]MCR8668957.1 hypothetical protein [Aestuariibaculum sp. M13]
MEFITDKQTLDDLNILGQYKSNSIFKLFNHTVTVGGSRVLEQMFNKPFSSIEAINNQSAIFSLFQKLNISLPFIASDFELVENYLASSQSSNLYVNGTYVLKSKFLNAVINDENYLILEEGVHKTLQFFHSIKEIIVVIEDASKNTVYQKQAQKLQALLNQKRFNLVWETKTVSKLTFQEVIKLNHLFRGVFYKDIQRFIEELYHIDVYVTVAKIAEKRGFTYAKASKKEDKLIQIEGLFHPSVPNAVSNDVSIDTNKRVLFLTGANMAGKSTLMKSFGVALYLAHMGFPVSAKHMRFSLHDGIFTSINVPDNLAKGYSHFYAEVLRVKHVATQVADNNQLLVIFDELFKGTNVKDASDGTIAIVDAFSKREGTFIISTHIIEAGEQLKENEKVFFKFLPTVVENNVPTYTYTLKEGLTDDRQGMMIIQNERIIETIKGEL